MLADVPTAVLVGSADKLTPPRFSAVIARALPRAHHEVLDGAGHMLPLERTETVAAHLLRLARGSRVGAGRGA